jgi:hypothetical protein
VQNVFNKANENVHNRLISKAELAQNAQRFRPKKHYGGQQNASFKPFKKHPQSPGFQKGVRSPMYKRKQN